MTPVVITGIGIISPLGCSLDEIAHRAAAGERVQPTDTDAEGKPTGLEIPLAAVPPGTRAHIARLDRVCRLFLVAAHLAVDAARLRITPPHAARVGLSFGTGLGCLLTDEEFNRKVVEGGPSAASPRLFAYTVSNAPAGEVSIALGVTGPNVTAHMGLAASLGAVGYGFDLVQMGQADVVLAGGADAMGPALRSALADMALLKDAQQARAFHDHAPGVLPSEGAAILVVERADRAAERGAPPWARIDGYAAGFEPTLTRAARNTRGLTATITRALQSCGRAPADVDLVVTSAHGTPIDEIERAALIAALGADSPAMLLAPKVAFGETFGASGVLGLGLAAGLLREAPPLAPGLAYDLRGRPMPAVDAAARLHRAEVVMTHSLCYSGNVVCLLLTRTP